MMSEEAQNIFEMIAKALNVDKNANFKVPDTIVNKIPEEKTKILRVDGFNPKNNNTLITNYFQKLENIRAKLNSTTKICKLTNVL